MARLDELAEGLAGVLAASPTPEQLPMDMWNETPPAATVLVRAVINACERRGTPLVSVAICAALGADLLSQHGSDGYEVSQSLRMRCSKTASPPSAFRAVADHMEAYRTNK